MKDFSKQNSHEENIKVSIDKILGSNSVIKRSKKSAEDHKRNIFLGIIDNLIAIDVRNNELDKGFLLDLTTYNSPFYLVIESLFQLAFTKQQTELIYFYLYERITPEGFMIELTDQFGQLMDLSTPEKLYEQIQKLK